MDADERLTALKKAYADIILNTAKEAAARIMVSAKNLVSAGLNVTKQQGLQMLLRLKQMLDSKANEAEMTYLSQQRKIGELEGQLRDAEDRINEAELTTLSQQRKIDELEAQLHEAEDIVKDLREELREVQAQLERVRSNKLQHTSECDTATQEQTSQENGFDTSQSFIFPPPASRLESFTTSDMKNSAFSQKNEVYKSYNGNDFRNGNSYIGRPDLPSTSEDNRLNTYQSIILPPPESQLESFTASDMKSSTFNKKHEVYKCHSTNDFHMGNSHVSKPNLPSIILRSKEPELYRNRRTQRIRAFEEKLMAGELSFSQTIDDVNYETSNREDGEREGICKTPTHKADNICSTEKKNVAQADSSWHQVKVKSFRKRRRATGYTRNKTPSSRYLSNQVLKRVQNYDGTEANFVNNNVQSSGDPSNMAPRLSADTTENGTLLGCTEITESDAEFVEVGSVQNTMNKDEVSTDKLLLMRSESGSAESSGVPICGMGIEKVDVPVVNSETKTPGTSSGIPYNHVADRVIKYTFQRKRKKESLSSSDGNAALEECILKKKTADKQNGSLEMEKSSSITESSRDSRRLAQVARQMRENLLDLHVVSVLEVYLASLSFAGCPSGKGAHVAVWGRCTVTGSILYLVSACSSLKRVHGFSRATYLVGLVLASRKIRGVHGFPWATYLAGLILASRKIRELGYLRYQKK
ncbi:hypothetical protein TEA_021763 [Camellia sinensis var. sinensis]|uniref:Uncharacterized protein n=1 Tax=Camellia sinensis var. sinensis TaxID=542762 RepID=A0A4S4EZU4_CAMSN|nr:hypothetical protein TEA_021763 [Camellia sinensis var. sinensis]